MKNNLLKKTLAVMMIGAMLAGVIGCGSSDTGGADNLGTAQQGADAASSGSNEVSAAAGETEIYWYSDVSGWGPSGWANGVTSSPLLDEIKARTGIVFDIEQPPTDADTKLALMIASDDLPDLISITDSDTINQLIDSGKVWAMEEFFETYDPESHLLTDFPEDIKNAVINKFGGWYSFPSHMESSDHRETYPMSCDIFEDNVTKGHNSAIMFNQNIMDELGISQEDVQTEAGFYAACEKVKNSGYTVDGQSVIPVVLHGNQWISSSLDGIISETFGVLPVDKEGNYIHLEMNPGYKEALGFVNKLIRNEYLDVNTLTLDENATLSYVESGRVFCWIANPAQSSKKAELSFTSFGPILAESGAVPTVPINLLAGTGWIQTFISKDCENPEALAKALSFATSEEGLWLNYYGIEGEDYTLQEDGTMVRTEDGLERYTNDYNSNIWLWPFNDTDFFWNTTPGPDEGTEEYVYGIINAAIGKYEDTYIYDIGLLSFVGTNVIEPSSDLGIKSSQITNYLESQKAKIVSSATEEAFEQEYQNMIDTLNSYDVTAVDEELNKVLQTNYELYGEKIENPNAAIYNAE